MMYWRALLLWLGLMVLAILNGGFREYAVIPNTSELTGHWISTVILCLLILLATWAGLKWLRPRNTSDTWRIGVFWTVLTVAFEFGAGHYIFKHPWSKLLADYNALNGRIWVLVLLTTLLAPWVVGIWRGLPKR